MIADIAKAGCPEQGITDGVDEHVGITVSKKPEVCVKLYTAKPELTVCCDAMNIIS